MSEQSSHLRIKDRREMKDQRRSLSPRLGLSAMLGMVTLVLVLGVSAASGGISGAVFTSTNPAVDNGGDGDPVLCVNGPADVNTQPANNCNIYTNKDYVWLSGGPGPSALEDGTYFFAVLAPGGQPDPNDGGAKLLSTDSYPDRTFTVSGGDGTITYGGTHGFANNEIRLQPYDDTTNPGGVYIMAVCSLEDGYPVDPSECKYDAFKVREGDDVTPPAADLYAFKDAAASFTRTHRWTIDKSVDACEVTNANPNGCSITGSSKTLNYTVTVTKTSTTDSGWAVSGTIMVFNPNDASVDASLSDQIQYGSATADPNASCTVYKPASTTPVGSTESIAGNGSADFPYACSYSAAPASTTEYNHATVSWAAQTVGGAELAAGSAVADSSSFDWSTPTTTENDCITVSDNMNPGGSGSISSGSAPSGTSVCTADLDSSNQKTFSYAVTVNVPHDCVTLTNTASFTPTTAVSSTGVSSDSVTTKVCRTPAATGALTIGFWQNKNGQSIISSPSYSGANCATLKTYLTGFNPFADYTGASCTAIAKYVYDVIKAATCSGPASAPCNKMLKAQMLATALNVFFSDPAHGNPIKAPVSLGGVVIDLQNICTMIDGAGGVGTCSGVYKDVSGAFGGATSLTVSAMLTYAASQASVGGVPWYGTDKTLQVCAKDAFDAINNRVAFSV